MELRKQRSLPIPGKVLVNVGDVVSPDTQIATALVPGYPVTIKVAAKLGVEQHQIKRYMVKQIGEQVKRGEIIARRKTFLGLSQEAVTSPISGTLESVDGNAGVCIVVSPPISVELTAFVAGTVAEVLPNEGAVISAPAVILEGIFGVGGEKYGELKVLAGPDVEIAESHITPNLHGCIIVGGNSISYEAVKKAVRCGVVGIICGSIDDKVLAKYVGYTISLPITGKEDIPTTLIITEGFGSLPMAPQTYSKLYSLQGNIASITGKTHIRAEITRPEIIIACDSKTTNTVSASNNTDLTPGAAVRIMSQAHLGQTGKVVGIGASLDELQSEVKSAVLHVALPDGQQVLIPRANLEAV